MKKIKKNMNRFRLSTFLIIFLLVLGSTIFLSYLVNDLENWADAYVEEKVGDDEYIDERVIDGGQIGNDGKTFFCMVAGWFSSYNFEREIIIRSYDLNLNSGETISQDNDYNVYSFKNVKLTPETEVDKESLFFEKEPVEKELSNRYSRYVTCDNYMETGEGSFIYDVYDALCNADPIGIKEAFILPTGQYSLTMDFPHCAGTLVAGDEKDIFLELGYIVIDEFELYNTNTETEKNHRVNEDNPAFFSHRTSNDTIINTMEEEGKEVLIENRTYETYKAYSCEYDEESELQDYQYQIPYIVNYKAAYLLSLDEFMLSFDTSGGNTIDPIIEYENNDIEKPANPIKSGYVFDGWYKDAEYNNPFIFEKMPDYNKTIYAKWQEEISYMDAMNFSLIDDDNYIEEKEMNNISFYYDDDKSILQQFEEDGYLDFLDSEHYENWLFDSNFNYADWRNLEYMPKYMVFIPDFQNETFYFSSADKKNETEIEKEYTIDFTFSKYNIKYDYIDAPTETLDYHYNYSDETQFLIDLMVGNDYDEVHDLSNVREWGLHNHQFGLKRNHSTYPAENVYTNIDDLSGHTDTLFLDIDLANGTNFYIDTYIERDYIEDNEEILMNYENSTETSEKDYTPNDIGNNIKIVNTFNPYENYNNVPSYFLTLEYRKQIEIDENYYNIFVGLYYNNYLNQIEKHAIIETMDGGFHLIDENIIVENFNYEDFNYHIDNFTKTATNEIDNYFMDNKATNIDFGNKIVDKFILNSQHIGIEIVDAGVNLNILEYISSSKHSLEDYHAFSNISKNSFLINYGKYTNTTEKVVSVNYNDNCIDVNYYENEQINGSYCNENIEYMDSILEINDIVVDAIIAFNSEHNLNISTDIDEYEKSAHQQDTIFKLLKYDYTIFDV